MASRRVTRKWEVFAGRNRFWCDGRLMTAPHPGVFALTLALICGTCALHFAFDSPFLAARVSAAVPAVGGALFVLTLSALLRTALSDPGIIPRAAPAEAAALEAGAPTADAGAGRPPPRAREVLVRGRPVKLKYCFTCKMFRPPRASHCSLCDNCVERFDHHCPWVGNCVGKRNYRHFYTFVVSLAFLAVFVFACAVTQLALRARGAGLAAALRAAPASALVAAVCFLSVWSVLGLAGFHTYLASTDQTTNEDIKGSFSTRRGVSNPNPYSRGNACANCWHVLCGPLAPSLIDRRGVFTIDVNDELPLARPRSPPPVSTPPVSVPPGSTPPVSVPPGSVPPGSVPPGSVPPGSVPPGSVPPGSVPPGSVPPGSVPLGSVPPGSVPPGSVPPGSVPPGSAPPAPAASPSPPAALQLDSRDGAGGPRPPPGRRAWPRPAGADPVPLQEVRLGVMGPCSGGGGGLSASRLRLLHDTTMIDAALDLDEPEPPPHLAVPHVPHVPHAPHARRTHAAAAL